MRVLLVNDWVAAEGGAERWVLDVRRLLEGAGHEVELLVSSAGSAADGGAEHVAFGTDAPGAQLLLQVANPSAVTAVRRAVRSFRPDVALVAMFEMHLSPAAVTALGDVPVAAVVLYYKPICPNGRKLWPDGRLCGVRAGTVCVRTGCVPAWLAPRELARYALIGRAMRRMSAVATCSRWMAEKLASSGVEATPLHLPLDAADPGYRRAPAGAPVFVYAGRLAEEKGVGDLLAAFAATRARHARASLRIVGDGPLATTLRDLAGDLGVAASVQFRGHVPRDAVAAEWADAWAAVVPSRWAEPFGLVAAEAIAHGVPVVASAAGGLAEVVDEGRTGLLFGNGDVESLAAHLDAIAAGRAFPGHSPDAAAAGALLARHGPDRHLAEVEELLTRAAG